MLSADAAGSILTWCDQPQATVAWCSAMDEYVEAAGMPPDNVLDALAEHLRRHFLTRAWDFGRADHVINMLAGYGQRRDHVPPAFWEVYLAFDDGEISGDERLLRARLARPGDRVLADPDTWVPSDFDSWGRGQGVGTIVTTPMPIADLGLVDVRWQQGRCTEDVAGLRWAPEAPGDDPHRL